MRVISLLLVALLALLTGCLPTQRERAVPPNQADIVKCAWSGNVEACKAIGVVR